MTDQKITELTALTAPAPTDMLAIVDDPTGTPETKKITVQDLGVVNIGRNARDGAIFAGVPGVLFIGANETIQLSTSTSRIFYEAFYVIQPIQIDRLFVVANVVNADAEIRAGIYAADEDLQPGAIIVDVGAIDLSGDNIVETVVDITLQPGRYLSAWHAKVVNPNATLRAWEGATPWGLAVNSGNALLQERRVGATYGPLADPGVAWSDHALRNGGSLYAIRYRWNLVS